MLSRETPAQGEITPKVHRMVNQGWRLLLVLFGDIRKESCSRIALLNQLRDAGTWISHVLGLEQVLAVCSMCRQWAFQ